MVYQKFHNKLFEIGPQKYTLHGRVFGHVNGRENGNGKNCVGGKILCGPDNKDVGCGEMNVLAHNRYA